MLFDVPADETLVHAIRLRLRRDTPFGYYTSWTRTDNQDFNEQALATTSRLKLFHHVGIELKQVQQIISAVNADAISAMHLKVKPGTALLSLERRSYDAEGRMVDLLSIQYRPDQFSYEMSLDVDAPLPTE